MHAGLLQGKRRAGSCDLTNAEHRFFVVMVTGHLDMKFDAWLTFSRHFIGLSWFFWFLVFLVSGFTVYLLFRVCLWSVFCET